MGETRNPESEARQKIERIALPVGGTTFVALSLYKWLLALLDGFGRWETAVSLSGHVAVFNSVWFTPVSLALGVLFLLFYQQFQMRQTLLGPPLVDADSKPYRSVAHLPYGWVKVLVGALLIALVAAGTTVVVWVWDYDPPPPKLSLAIAVPLIYKTPVKEVRRSAPALVVSGGKNIVGQITGGTNVVGDVTINPDVNPNKPVTTYDCGGTWRRTGSDAVAALHIEMDGDETRQAFKEMAELNNKRQWGALLLTCTAQMKSAPEWLTPYLFCSMGQLALQDREKARELLRYYDSKAGPAYKGECGRLAEYLHGFLDRP